jgi:hypothetical protein
VSASATCPLCGRRQPHKHSGLEQTIYRNGVKAGRAAITAPPTAASILKYRDLTWAQQARHDFITRRLSNPGYINRVDLQDAFEISTPQASIDLNRFMKMEPKAMAYNATTKRYERQPANGRTQHGD